ncbi:hypothetical protein MLD38_040254 [Melastoma candidum]|uniref:Uncharacterized protein n=1 Tax=Melastoma candidum TaxID=119954 RepID=A0ACB9L622_9MYRT|nr:hypothetical protein MLD38_040254 [Melastoma candidum]
MVRSLDKCDAARVSWHSSPLGQLHFSARGAFGDALGALRRFLGKADVTAEDMGREVGQKRSLLKERGSSTDDVANATLFSQARIQGS